MDWKILVVDDDVDIINLLKMRLMKKFECMIFEASNGDDALDLARINSLDLVILDILMPKKSGDKVFFELRNDQVTKDLPILFCTAINDRNFVRALLTRITDSVTDFIIKPIQIPLLYGKVERLIEKATLLSQDFYVNEFGLGGCQMPQIGLEYAIQIVRIEGIYEDDEYSILINDRLQKGRLLSEHKPIVKVPFNEDGTIVRILFKFLYTRKRNMKVFYKII
jgi:CheY-like chemotaxis protein